MQWRVGMNGFNKLNVLYTNIDEFKQKPISILIKEDEPWSYEETFKNILSLCEYSINYYNDKYNLLR